MVCLRNICINSLHKGDNDDDDNNNILTQLDYKRRHDSVAKLLHDKRALKDTLLNESTPYYKYTLSKVLENDVACLYWDRGILTGKTVPHNRPDITLFEKTNKIFYLIDVCLSNSGNLQTAYSEKMIKYAELITEVKQQWQV